MFLICQVSQKISSIHLVVLAKWWHTPQQCFPLKVQCVVILCQNSPKTISHSVIVAFIKMMERFVTCCCMGNEHHPGRKSLPLSVPNVGVRRVSPGSCSDVCSTKTQSNKEAGINAAGDYRLQYSLILCTGSCSLHAKYVGQRTKKFQRLSRAKLTYIHLRSTPQCKTPYAFMIPYKGLMCPASPSMLSVGNWLHFALSG